MCPLYMGVLCLRDNSRWTKLIAAVSRAPPGGGIQEERRLPSDTTGAAEHQSGQSHWTLLQTHRHLQHPLLPPVQMGSPQNLQEPHAQPSDILRSGKLFYVYDYVYVLSRCL